MGVKRGSFESVSLSSQVERAVEHSTIRPDEGAPLRIGAKALDSWSDAFGKMANLASKVKAKQDANKATQATCKDAMNQAVKDYEDYSARPKNEQDATQLERLRGRAESTSARYDASMKLGVFSGNFDMNRDYRKAETK